MKTNSPPTKMPAVVRTLLSTFRQQAGYPLIFWALIALFNFALQILFRHELPPGEFGTLNTALGVIGLLNVPIAALSQAIALYLAQPHPPEHREKIESLRASAVVLLDSFAWAWAAASLVLLLVFLPRLDLPRHWVGFFIFFNVLVALGGAVGTVIYQNGNRVRFWSGLLLVGAAARLLIGAGLGLEYPWADAGLIALLASGALLLKPLFDHEFADWPVRLRAWRAAQDRDFLVYSGATLSVAIGLFLFLNADRIVAQCWFGFSDPANMGFVDWSVFDAYHTAGLLGRSLVWGLQPLLLVFFVQRASLTRTTAASFTYFWIYVGALVPGSFLLALLSQPLSRLFCGHDFQGTAAFVPSFALVMVPVGLLQALGVFALASRRFHECFLIGGCGFAYFILLDLVGRQPELMIAYIFGGASSAILIVLFVGIVRWGRKQP
jgi:O-antigen/teichoic acid export membrane protein